LTFKPSKKVTKKGHLPTLCRELNEAYLKIDVGTLWREIFGEKMDGK
jgi:hypothetical protein